MISASLPSAVLLLALAVAAPCVAAETPEATEQFLARFSDALSRVGTVYSEFVQERQMQLLSEPLISKGVILFRKPNEVRWETTEPYRSVLIARDKEVAQFEWMGDGWTKLKLGYAAAMKKVMESLTLTWNGRIAEQSKDYAFSLRSGDETILIMTPRDAGLREFVNAIEMHIDKDSFAAQSVILREPAGDVTIIRMHNQHLNVDLPAGCFDLEAPLALDKIQQAVRNEK